CESETLFGAGGRRGAAESCMVPLPYTCSGVRAGTFQAPGEVLTTEKPDPEPGAPDEALVRIEASGVCGSDLHIYHGRVGIEPGFTLGHEYVGSVVAAGAGVDGIREGDRVLGTYCTACGECFFCARGDFHKCDRGRVVGHPDALELACRLVRKAGVVSATGVYAERVDLHMGIVWIKALTLKSGHANVIKHLDPVLDALAAGRLDPTPLVTHHMPLDEAAEAYRIYDRREALKIVLTP